MTMKYGVGCVLTVNILDTCSLNAIFSSRVWFDQFRWWDIHFGQYHDSPLNFSQFMGLPSCND